MKKIEIKGKEYVMVNERIMYFRENFKDWSLTSELIGNKDGVVIFKATIVDPEGNIKAVGHAMEKEGAGFINKTSHIENCETSAWGRALGCLGIGIDTSIASAEEVGNAVKQQDSGSQRKRATSKKFIAEKSLDIARQRIKKGFDYLNFNKEKQQDWIDEHLPVGLADATIDDLNSLLEALEKEAKEGK